MPRTAAATRCKGLPVHELAILLPRKGRAIVVRLHPSGAPRRCGSRADPRPACAGAREGSRLRSYISALKVCLWIDREGNEERVMEMPVDRSKEAAVDQNFRRSGCCDCTMLKRRRTFWCGEDAGIYRPLPPSLPCSGKRENRWKSIETNGLRDVRIV